MYRANRTPVLIGISVVIIAAAFITGVYFGYGNRPEVAKITALVGTMPPTVAPSEKIDFAPFWKAWNAIDEKYTPANGTSTEITAQDKVWGAIQGLVASLGDPYSVFLPPADASMFEENINGNFGGVGMEIGIRDKALTVIAPLKNTPAARAGIQAGDIILKIDDALTADMSVEKAVRLIRGEIGTTVTLLLSRKEREEPFEIKVVRDVIVIPTIDTEELPDGVFVIKLYNFSAQSPRLFREALREFVLSGNDKLILDMRGNPGGFLEAAVDIASWFLPSGAIVVSEDFGPHKADLNVMYRSKGYDIFTDKLKMAILVDGGSASASEIVAGALSEHGTATLVGEQTFGKGSVQELIKITPDTSLKLTVAHWKTPKGTIISKSGLTPQYKVTMTEKDREAKKDPQMERAVGLLVGSPAASRSAAQAGDN
ncbi:MAG: S41 family peptidase [Parcubacteria group bacterium]|nr:S41 family peptidase [Parcubacteria group bacterium]